MPEKIKVDRGMMEQDELRYRMDDPGDVESCIAASREWADSFPAAEPGDWPGDALRRRNAGCCRDILAKVGLADDSQPAVNAAPLRQKGLTEDTAPWIAANWLARYHLYTVARQRVQDGDLSPDNLSTLVFAAEEMGRLQERMWWRAGTDPGTGERREALMQTGRAVKRGQKRGAEITNRANEAARKRRFARMAELVPSLGVENAARQCECEGLGGWQGIKRAWYRAAGENRDTPSAVTSRP